MSNTNYKKAKQNLKSRPTPKELEINQNEAHCEINSFTPKTLISKESNLSIKTFLNPHVSPFSTKPSQSWKTKSSTFEMHGLAYTFSIIQKQ